MYIKSDSVKEKTKHTWRLKLLLGNHQINKNFKWITVYLVNIRKDDSFNEKDKKQMKV